MEFWLDLVKPLTDSATGFGLLLAAGLGLLYYLVRYLVPKWITARLTLSIKHEYDTQLEELKKKNAESLEEFKYGLLRQTEEFKANLQHENVLAQVRFTKSFELLVKAIGEIYEKLRAYKEAVVIDARTHDLVTNDGVEQRAREFEECFLPREIILSQELAQKVRKLSGQLARVKQIADSSRDNRERGRVREELESANTLFAEVFSAFQELVGIDQRQRDPDGA